MTVVETTPLLARVDEIAGLLANLRVAGSAFRLQIIAATWDAGERSPVELAEQLDASLGGIAYHVRVLARIGILELADESRVRGAVKHHYRLTRAGRDAAALIGRFVDP